ncbi:MAG: prepilin-type N-terminal cleavage/methylation domain-containing protein [Planctomycetota bacterium]
MHTAIPATRPCHKGFTILELLLATTLATILMVAVLGVVGSIRRVPEMRPARAGHEQRLETLVQRDLIESEHIVLDKKGGLRVLTYAAIDPETYAHIHAPVWARYRVVESGGQSWLVRDQKHIDPLRSELSCTTRLSPDIYGIRLGWTETTQADIETGGSIETARERIDTTKILNEGLDRASYPREFELRLVTDAQTEHARQLNIRTGLDASSQQGEVATH